jgi:hypothetical protein
MEIFVERHKRKDMLRDRHRSMVTSLPVRQKNPQKLHSVMSQVLTDNAMTYKETDLEAFLEKEGASDRTSFAVITEAAIRKGVGSTVVRWVNKQKPQCLGRALKGMRIEAVHSQVCFHACREAWVWTRSLSNLMKKVIILQGMQMKLRS